MSANLREKWQPLAEKALRGKPVDGLVQTTSEGIELQPIYFDAGGHRAETNARAGWDVRAWLPAADAQLAEEALADGAGSLWIETVDAAKLDDSALQAIVARGVVVDQAAVPSGIESHLRGADAATELAEIVAAHRSVGGNLVRVAVGPQLFATIAKIRALRCLLPGVAVHAVGSRRYLAETDVPTNMIRGTAMCVAAAIGGADVITVLPWDAAKSPGTRLSRRIAVTLHAVAAREANLGAVADPAAGSYLLERWTADLIAQANERLLLPTKRSYDETDGPKIGVTMFVDPMFVDPTLVAETEES